MTETKHNELFLTPLEQFLLNFKYTHLLNTFSLDYSNQIFVDYIKINPKLFNKIAFCSSLNFTFKSLDYLKKMNYERLPQYDFFDFSANRNITLNCVLENPSFSWDINGLSVNINFLDITFSDEISNMKYILKNGDFCDDEHSCIMINWIEDFEYNQDSVKNFLFDEPFTHLGIIKTDLFLDSISYEENVDLDLLCIPLEEKFKYFVTELNSSFENSKEYLLALLWCIDNLEGFLEYSNKTFKYLMTFSSQKKISFSTLIISFFHNHKTISQRYKPLLEELHSFLLSPPDSTIPLLKNGGILYKEALNEFTHLSFQIN